MYNVALFELELLNWSRVGKVVPYSARDGVDGPHLADPAIRQLQDVQSILRADDKSVL